MLRIHRLQLRYGTVKYNIEFKNEMKLICTSLTHEIFYSQSSQSQPNNEQITNYLKPQDMESEENRGKNTTNNNNNEDKSTGDNKENPPSENKSGSFSHFLDDEEDDAMLVDLDF